MTCSSCGGGGAHIGTCVRCSPSPCDGKDSINWLLPVEKLPIPKYATRRYMYMLPDNTLYILNYDGNDYLEIATVTPEIVEVEGVEE